MENEKNIKIDTKSLYQFLVSECRYGYSRNNHLMPSEAYNHVKQFIPEMFEVDSEYAIDTLKQLAEECISIQLSRNFYNGIDDDYGNRKEAIEFIEYCLENIRRYYSGWRPYNFDLYEENLEHDNDKIYNLYLKENGETILLDESPASVKEYPNIIFDKLGSEVVFSKRKEDNKIVYVIHNPKKCEIIVERTEED